MGRSFRSCAAFPRFTLFVLLYTLRWACRTAALLARRLPNAVSLSVVRRTARSFRDRGTQLDQIIEGCASNASTIAAPCQLRQFQSAEAKYSDRNSEQGMKSQRFPKIVAARQRRNLWKSSRETASGAQSLEKTREKRISRPGRNRNSLWANDFQDHEAFNP